MANGWKTGYKIVLIPIKPLTSIRLGGGLCPREGFPSRGIRSLAAMGSGLGQDQEFQCRRRRRRRRRDGILFIKNAKQTLMINHTYIFFRN